MYGVESAVHPDYQGQGIGSKLMDARFDVLRRLNLRGMIAGSMIMGYHKIADVISPEDYVREVVAGTRYDNNLTKQLHMGFKVHNLIPNYCPDPRALDWGVAIVWHNPDYLPGKKVSGRVIPGHFGVSLKAKLPQVAAAYSAKAQGAQPR
jgi:ribosomal protein S18 acetylase RimI-like enzyme